MPASAERARAGRADPRPLTLRDVALVALGEMVAATDGIARGPAGLAPELRFLIDHRAAFLPPSARGSDLLAQVERGHAPPAAQDLPLHAIADAYRLSFPERLAIALLVAVEQEPLIGRVIAFLQAPVGGSRPSLGLLAAAFNTAPHHEVMRSLFAGPAVGSGLVRLGGEERPIAEQVMSLAPPIFLALGGEDGAWPGINIGLGATPEVPLAESVAGEAARRITALAVERGRALALRSGSPAEARSVACAMAAAVGCRAAFVEPDTPPAHLTGVAAWLHLRRLIPVFCCELGPSDRRAIPPLPFFTGPTLAIAGPDGAIESSRGAVPSWQLPVPSRAERERLWISAIGDAPLSSDLATFHRHGSGRIAHLGRLARYHADIEGAAAPSLQHVRAAAWTGEGAGLGGLAQPLTHPVGDDALVTTAALRQDLQTLLLRCRSRDGLAEGLGASVTTRYHPGVRALFVGPSGTGKTLAAGWLATRLGVPLYRVDLASVTSKYIGETEKNLAQLLARAEQADVVLLFDEADSLFGKRTEVKEANDRFANAQTNYLLQRIESFDGVTLLTSNSRTRFDAAFSRRLDVVIDFAAPGPEERRALWLSHLGGRHALTPKALNKIAATVDLSGGHIRNVVLAAAATAQGDGRPIGYRDLAAGLASEYRKLGRQVPAEIGFGEEG